MAVQRSRRTSGFLRHDRQQGVVKRLSNVGQLVGQQRALSNNAKRKGLVTRITQVGGLTKARTRFHWALA
jgi:hypothetical protein